MAANGNLIFQDTNKATFVGANSNVVIDTVNASFGVGVDVNGPTSNLEQIANNGNVTSNTVQFTNATTGFVTTSNIEVGGALKINTITAAAYHALSAVTAVGASTGDTIQLTNATTGLVTTANVDVGGDMSVTGNLTVLGTKTIVDTDTLRVKDPIIELGKDNPGTGDLGLVMTRPSGSSNVGIIFDESADTLEIGYTQSNASDTDITMRTAATEPLDVSVNGNVSVGKELTVSGNVEVGTANLFVDTVNSRVGVGTTSPGAPLTIKASKGNINASDMASLRSNAAVRVNAFSSSADTLLMGHLSTDTAGDSGDNPRFYIQNVWDNSTTGREILINPAGGNVGIGTNAPNAKLQVDYTEGTLSDMNYSTTSSWHDKGLGIKGGQGGFLYGLDINHSIFLRRSPFGATDHNAYCNVGYHAFYTGGMIENQTEKMRIHANGNVDILTGDLNVVGSYKSDGKTVQRTLIGYQKYTSSTSVSYSSGTTGYQNPWSVTYTRIHSGSEIYIIGDLCLAQAMGATGTTSYRGIYGRLKVYSGTTNYYSDSTYDWQRIDNSFHEYQRQSRVHFDKHALPETTAGQTITIYAQVEEGGKSGTTNAFGINIWAGRSFIEVFEVM